MTDPRIGQKGTARVEWQNGHVTHSEGVVIAINETLNEVYLETVFGPVSGDLDTLEIEE